MIDSSRNSIVLLIWTCMCKSSARNQKPLTTHQISMFCTNSKATREPLLCQNGTVTMRAQFTLCLSSKLVWLSFRILWFLFFILKARFCCWKISAFYYEFCVISEHHWDIEYMYTSSISINLFDFFFFGGGRGQP